MNVSYEHSQLYKQCVSMLAFIDTAKSKNHKWYHYSLKNQSIEMISGVVRHCKTAPLPTNAFNPKPPVSAVHAWRTDSWENKLCLRCQSMGLEESCLSSLSQETGTYIPLPHRFFPQFSFLIWFSIKRQEAHRENWWSEARQRWQISCLNQNLAFQYSNCKSDNSRQLCSLNLKGQV